MIFQDFPGPGIFKKEKRRTFQEAWEPCNIQKRHKCKCSCTNEWSPVRNCISLTARHCQQSDKASGKTNKHYTAGTTRDAIAQFAITINSNVCPHIRVPNMLMRNPMHDVIGIFNSEARYYAALLPRRRAAYCVALCLSVCLSVRPS